MSNENKTIEVAIKEAIEEVGKDRSLVEATLILTEDYTKSVIAKALKDNGLVAEKRVNFLSDIMAPVITEKALSSKELEELLKGTGNANFLKDKGLYERVRVAIETAVINRATKEVARAVKEAEKVAAKAKKEAEAKKVKENK